MESLSYNFEARSFVVLVVVIYFFLSLTLYCLSVLRRSQQARENGCEQVPTYPHIDPILGLDALYRSLRAIQRGHVMEELDSRFNTINGGVSTFSTVLMGSKILHTIEPENIKTILSTRSKDYHHSPGRKAAFGYFGPGIFINDGPEWELSRAMLRPSFTKTQVRNLPALEEHVHNLIARIPKEGQTIDLQPLFLQLTNDTIFETLMGESTYTLLHSSTETKHMQVADAVEYVTEFAAFRLRIGPLASLWLGPKFRKSMAYINNYVSDHVSRALASQREKSASEMAQDPSGNVEESQKYNFLKELVKTHQNSDRIQAELLHVLGAGRETTAALLSVLCYTVARRPDILQKLRKEIVQQVGDNKPTYNDVREMKYLKWTISESKCSPFNNYHHTDPIYSPKTLPRRPNQQPRRDSRHNPPPRRRHRRQIASVRQSRYSYPIIPVFNAPAKSVLWRRCT